MKTLYGTVLFGFALLVAPDYVSAQRRWATSFELGFGTSFGTTTGEYDENGDGMSADVTIARRLHGPKDGGFVAATTVAVQGWGPEDDLCIPRSGTTDCVPTFPEFVFVSILGGYEVTSTNIRVLTGPALAFYQNAYSPAWVARFDGAIPLFGHLSLSGSARGTIVTGYRGNSFKLGAISVGVRFR